MKKILSIKLFEDDLKGNLFLDIIKNLGFDITKSYKTTIIKNKFPEDSCSFQFEQEV